MSYQAPAELISIIQRREGLRLRMYTDTKGIPSIGYGHNLRDVPISQRAADVILADDLETIAHQVAGVVGDAVWSALNEPRQAALIDMGMMGPAKLAQFHKMLGAIYASDWPTAAQEARNSGWAADVGPARTDEVCAMLLTGNWPDA